MCRHGHDLSDPTNRRVVRDASRPGGYRVRCRACELAKCARQHADGSHRRSARPDYRRTAAQRLPYYLRLSGLETYRAAALAAETAGA